MAKLTGASLLLGLIIHKGNETSRFRVLNEDFFGNQFLFDSGKLKADSSVTIDINVIGVEYPLLMFEGKKTFGDWADAKVLSH